MSTYKCYTRWNKGELICFCKIDNPGCDRYKTCHIEKAKINKYEGIMECFRNSEKRK
ncbi:hypothetical protein [Clostridium sp. C2-6-12]|uniref:hypothetical protein n=1 Tax=Clostridium sp. C2-6-12 TaxID=2698832 RepID=UPI00192286F2|nr:hypothetical protein [Clostridium sp. C2-6-12]